MFTFLQPKVCFILESVDSVMDLSQVQIAIKILCVASP